MRRLASRLLGSVVVMAATAVAAAAPTPRSLYETAVARAEAAHARFEDADSPAARDIALRASRGAVATFEGVARRFPTSGYCDDALWRGAELAAETWRRLGQNRDRAAAQRLASWLQREYPTSRLRAHVPDLLARLEPRPAMKGSAPRTAVTSTAPEPAEGSRRAAPPADAPRGSAPGAARARSVSAAPAPAPRGPVPPLRPAAWPPGAPVARGAEVPDDYVAGSARPSSAAASASSSRAAPLLARLRGVRRDVLPTGVRVTLEFDGEVAYQDEQRGSPPRVLLDLRATRPEAGLPAMAVYGDGAVRQVRVAPLPANGTRVMLDTNGTVPYSVFALYNPFRLIVDFESTAAARAASDVPPRRSALADTRDRRVARQPADAPAPPLLPWSRSSANLLASSPALQRPADARATPLPAAAVAPPAAPAVPATNVRGGFSLSRQLGLSVSRIVLDPGHGGHDPGAQLNGLSESALVLDIALRVEKLLLKQPGSEVTMTRRTETFVPLGERTAIANRAGADLFLSIHANASPNPRTRGIETYFLNFALNPEAEAIAARENASSGRAMRNLPDIVKAIALNNKIDESRDFAAFVQDALVGKVKGGRNLGVKQAPFVVLIGATMPSILAEISFITNREDAQQLKTAAHRQKVAEAIANGILRYQRSLKATATIATQ